MPIMRSTLLDVLAGAPAASDPNAWWKSVPPAQRDWWQRRLNAMPHAGGAFRDDIFLAPKAPGTETLDFDRNTIDPNTLRR
jgi:hypothetical protein